MAVSIYGRSDHFESELGRTQGAVYWVFGPNLCSPERLLYWEGLAVSNGHTALAEFREFFPDALKDIECFFAGVASLDAAWEFAFSSKVLLAIPSYRDIQQIFVLRKLLRARPNCQVLLYAPTPRLQTLLGRIFKSNEQVLLSAIPSLAAWKRFIRTLARVSLLRPRVGRMRLLFCSLATSPPTNNDDPYFGELPVLAAKKAPTVTVYIAAGKVVNLPNSNRLAPLESFASCLDVLKCWCRTITAGVRINSCVDADVLGDLLPLFHFLRGEEIRSGEFFMHQFYRRAFAKMVRTAMPSTLVYPFENRTWEKILLQEIRRYGRVTAVGYQHSSITPRHLALSITEDESGSNILPDRIVTIGQVTADWLCAQAPVLAGRISIGASFRRVRQKIDATTATGVLLAISSSRDEAWNMMRIAYDAACNCNVPIIIRSHPTIPVSDMYNSFKWPPQVTLSIGTTLAEDLAQSTVVAYSSSTVALEGMLHGRFPLFVDIGDLPSGDPIPDDAPFKLIARSGHEFGEKLTEICNVGVEQRSMLQEAVARYAESYLAEPSTEIVNRMLALMDGN